MFTIFEVKKYHPSRLSGMGLTPLINNQNWTVARAAIGMRKMTWMRVNARFVRPKVGERVLAILGPGNLAPSYILQAVLVLRLWVRRNSQIV